MFYVNLCSGVSVAGLSNRGLATKVVYVPVTRQNFTLLDDWLTVHRSTTLVDFQLDAQNSYLFIYVYNTFIKILRPCIVVQPWLISNFMHKILIYLYMCIIHLLKSSDRAS